MVLNGRLNIFFALCLALCVLISVGGCTTAPMREDRVLAMVDGVPLTRGDLDYSLQVAHRREDLSTTGSLDLRGYLDKIIDDKLITQEARRMGLERLQEIRQAIDAFILRESVVRLYNGEIKGKVSVTEDEIKAYFMNSYELFTIDTIGVKSEAAAKQVVEELKGGKDFSEVAKEFSPDGETTLKLRRKSLAEKPAFEDAILGLVPGEFSDAVKEGNDYYIVRLVSREKPSEEDIEKLKGRLESEIRKEKEDERSNQYLEQLRQGADIDIDRELLAEFRPEKAESWVGNDKPLATVYGSVLTIGEFASMYKSTQTKERILNGWIDIRLVDHEALRRNYAAEPPLKDAVRRYEDRLISNMFVMRVIVPQVEVSEEAIREYYADHSEKYVRDARFKVQQITVKTMEEAEDVLDNLKGGADFSWLAKTKSTDEAAYDGGDLGWKGSSELPEEVINLQPGEISPIIDVGTGYRIMRVQMRTPSETEDFENVKGAVYKDYFGYKVNSILEGYISQLKAEAEIEIDSRALRSLEKEMGK